MGTSVRGRDSLTWPHPHSQKGLVGSSVSFPVLRQLELHEAHVPRANNTIKCTCS